MTTALHTLATAPFVLFLLAAIVVTCLVVWLTERSQSIDEHTRQHRDHGECPWCAASDEAVAERQRQRDRAAIARQRVVRQEARLRSVDGGRR